MEYSKLIKSLESFKNLQNEFMSGKIGGAYLFCCPDKLTANVFLVEVAKMLETLNATDRGTIAKIDAGSHPDVLVYPKGKSFMVDDASDIYDKVQVKPMLAVFKVFIINEIDNSTEQAQNKMLKIIEEPPKNVVFLISCISPENILKTIKSRTQIINIGRMDKSLIALAIDCEKQMADMALAQGDGYLGKTLDIINNKEYIEAYNNCLNIITNLKKSDQITSFSGLFSKNKDIFLNYINILNDFMRDILMIKLEQNKLVKNIGAINEISSLASEYSIIALLKILNEFIEVNKMLNSNVNLVSLAENMLLTILEVKFLCK